MKNTKKNYHPLANLWPTPKTIDYTKFIEPKKQILVTKNGLTNAELVSK